MRPPYLEVMKKNPIILVPTDFSAASRPGIRFALQWASQGACRLVFAHVVHILRPTSWSDKKFEAYWRIELDNRRQQLDEFAREMLRKEAIDRKAWSCVLLEGPGADIAIMDYCTTHAVDVVCMGTRGAGRMKKLFGTNTANLIAHSNVPVIAVPATWRRRKITRLLYASDLADYTRELRTVVGIARPLHARLSLVHCSVPGEMPLDKRTIESVWSRQFRYPVETRFRTWDRAGSLVDEIEKAAQSIHPSLVVLFSNRERTLFQQLFTPSRAQSLAFRAKLPLLVLNKAHIPLSNPR